MINLRPGEVFPLSDLLRAMIVTSANDAAVAIAEQLYGSVENCVKAMNRRARELGMTQTLYQTPNGLPLTDGTPPDISSAIDMATLARALVKHRQILEWTSLRAVPFRDGRVMLPNTNHLVGKVTGVDGLKTGFTYKARFNLVTTAQRDQLRLIAVVMGGQSSGIRFRIAADLLEWGFAHFTRLRLIKSGEPVGAEVRVEYGSVSMLQPVAATDAAFLVRKGEAGDVQVSLQVPSVVAAPITRHQVLGEVVVRNSKRILAIVPALSPWDVPKARWFPAQR
jgi:D-alanyl-D-alanine carboxypeptidase (penicillin-binding protein 5/6)